MVSSGTSGFEPRGSTARFSIEVFTSSVTLSNFELQILSYFHNYITTFLDTLVFRNILTEEANIYTKGTEEAQNQYKGIVILQRKLPMRDRSSDDTKMEFQEMRYKNVISFHN
jgi:hypothetical protein